MSEQQDQNSETQADVAQAEDRRAFLAKAGKIAVAAPAGALLLAATTKHAAATTSAVRG